MTVPADRIDEIESLVTDWLHDHDVPGASVVLFDRDGERYAAGFGARELDGNRPATPDTLYGMGSVTKPLTALAILQLAESDHLSITDSVDSYVDHYSAAPGPPITVAELLSHTSGVPATGPDRALLRQSFQGVPAGVATEADRERFVEQASEFRATDEERFFYYNTGYNVLGRVVEEVDGRPFETYVREEILDPLRMERTAFARDRFEAADDTATAYQDGESAPQPAALPFEELLYPSAGIVSSVREMSRFVRAMLTDGSLDGQRVASAEMVNRLQAGRTTRQTYVDGTVREYGYGWMRQPVADDEVVGHGGGVGVSTAFVGFLEGAGVGVAIACNTSPAVHPTEVGSAVLAIAAGHSRTVVPQFALHEKCRAVTGTYESFRGSFATLVERDEGGISLRSPEQDENEGVRALPTTLEPDTFEFYTVASDGARHVVEFDLDGEYDDMFFRRTRLRRVD